jgi:hypothetical protein
MADHAVIAVNITSYVMRVFGKISTGVCYLPALSQCTLWKTVTYNTGASCAPVTSFEIMAPVTLALGKKARTVVGIHVCYNKDPLI